MADSDESRSPNEPLQAVPVAPVPPAVVSDLYPDAVDGLRRYAELLADAGVVRGLIGPREVDRLWDRHILNCAVVSELIPVGARVVDIGSGAGLPGVPLALVRPDLQVGLVESLARRATFLEQAVDVLGLQGRVYVCHGRAEDAVTVSTVGGADVVTARAVSSLEKLWRWSAPLLKVDGSLLALKGESAEAEVAEQRELLRRLGAAEVAVEVCGSESLTQPTRVVRAIRRR